MGMGGITDKQGKIFTPDHFIDQAAGAGQKEEQIDGFFEMGLDAPDKMDPIIFINYLSFINNQVKNTEAFAKPCEPIYYMQGAYGVKNPWSATDKPS